MTTNPIRMSRPGNKGHVYILAALTLPFSERMRALDDISELLGMTYADVLSASDRMKAKAVADALEKAQAKRKGPIQSKPVLEASKLKPPSAARLMAGR